MRYQNGALIPESEMVGLGNGADRQERLDRYTSLYALSFLATYFLVFIAYVPLFFILCGVVFGVAFALYALRQFAAALSRRQWRRTLSIAVPLLSIATLYGMHNTVAPRDKVWIAAMLPFRWLQVQIEPSNQPRFVAFSADCRRFGGFGTNPDCLSMVYDESDEIGFPGDKRPREWRTRNERDLMTSESACGDCAASHVIGHFWVQYIL
jgi:hypothetical protein